MKTATYPEVGWMKERFQVLTLNDHVFEFNFFMQAGASVPAHLHKESDEHFTILEGELTFNLEGENFIAKAGEQVTVPKMKIHSISNKSTAMVKCRVAFKPVADQGKFFEILHFLARQNPNDKNALFKAMYIAKEMNYKAFSTMQGPMRLMESLMYASFKLIAPLSGWNALLKSYQNDKAVSSN